MKNILPLVVGAILLAGAAYGQSNNAAGTWDVSFTTPNGPMTVALTLKKDGEKLSGTIAGPQGEVAIEGTQKEAAVAINFTAQTPNGPFDIAMTGNQAGDGIVGTIDFGGQGQSEWTGKRRGVGATPAAAAPAPAAGGATAQADKIDVTGAWALQLDIGGNAATPSVTFKQDGEKLTGTYFSQLLGEQPLTGTVKGSAIAFGFMASFDGNSVQVTYTGTVEKDAIKGTVTFGDMGEGTFTAKRK
jgi:hypothetical protein